MNAGNGVYYTSVVDDWNSLMEVSGLSKKDLVEINPHLAGVEEVVSGIPINMPFERRQQRAIAIGSLRNKGKSAYQIAKDELSKDVKEIPGKKNNSRIVMYHSSTNDGAMPDEVSWCSSFVNWCMEQSGKKGTDSKAARSWLDWGSAISKSDWQEGDIIVFWRVHKTKSWKGHVGFLVDWDADRPSVLGGNQGDKLCIDTPYSFNRILSVRRGK